MQRIQAARGLGEPQASDDEGPDGMEEFVNVRRSNKNPVHPFLRWRMQR